MIRFRSAHAMALLCGLFILGCALPRTASHYVLVAIAPLKAPVGDASKGPRVVVNPVSLPGYLDRPQIVSRRDAAELQIAQLERWSEDLAENATRVLADDLAARLPSERVGVLRPGTAGTEATRLAVEVSRFEQEPDGQVTLVARWSLRREGRADPYLVRRSSIREVPSRSNTAGVVEAMSRALARLADEIARALQPGHA